MKPSIYNFIWPTDSHEKVMLFNSLTTSLAEAENSHTDLLDLASFDYDRLPADSKRFVDELIKGGFIVDDEADEQKILKYTYNSNKYNRIGLTLTIAPTMHCNFACTYCYEQSGQSLDTRAEDTVFMPEDVQEALLQYIERAAKTVKSVFITWYGGEPLLGKEIIFDLSKKIIDIANENKIVYFAGMITNGYLLAEDSGMIQKLKDSHIRSYQITLDGPPEVHNSRRMRKGDNGPTFDQVLEGLKRLKANELSVSLRINVDHSNRDGAIKLLDILEENDLKEIPIELGRISADTAGCKSIESSCTTMEEFSVLDRAFRETLRTRGFKAGQKPEYPHIAHTCGANRMNAFVLDPDGDMYKCWSEIGNKPARIGNIMDIDQRTRQERMHEIRWLTWEPFEYPDCLECKILPLCMGSCGYRAMFVNRDKPDCAEWKYCLEQSLRARFSWEKKKKEL